MNGDDLFASGDYAFWSDLFFAVSEELVAAAGVAAGDLVLDVAAGDGNTALAATGVGADVTAVDLSPAQIARGRRRMIGVQSPVRWVRGRGEQLPFRSGTFDSALDTFGDVLDDESANPALTEMARVVAPHGVVGFTHWTREGFDGAWGQLERRFLAGTGAPASEPHIGQEVAARKAVEPFATAVTVDRRVLAVRWRSADAFADAMLERDPYLHDFRRRLPSERWDEFSSELRGLVHRWNTARDGTLLIEMPYIRVIARS